MDPVEDAPAFPALDTRLEQRNAAARAQIERAAGLMRGDEGPDWLAGVLESHELDPEAGILVEYDAVEDQDGTLCYGTWLTRSRQFWAFEVRVTAGAADDPRVEVFEDITAMTLTSRNVPGFGKTFGALALEVLATLVPDER